MRFSIKATLGECEQSSVPLVFGKNRFAGFPFWEFAGAHAFPLRRSERTRSRQMRLAAIARRRGSHENRNPVFHAAWCPARFCATPRCTVCLKADKLTLRFLGQESSGLLPAAWEDGRHSCGDLSVAAIFNGLSEKMGFQPDGEGFSLGTRSRLIQLLRHPAPSSAVFSRR